MADNNYTQNGKVEINNTNAYESNGTNNGGITEITEIGKPLTGGIEMNIVPSNKVDTLFTLDMSQGSFFTLEIDGLMLDKAMFHKAQGPNSSVATGYGQFLPVKSLDYTPASLENKQLDAGIFRDLFLIEKKKMGLLNITLLDTSDNKYELAFTDWFSLPGNSSISGVYNGYIGYIVDWAKVCRYNEFTVRGELSKSYEFMVLPSGDVKTQRAYDNNQLKEISFSLMIGSDITLIKSSINK